LAMGGVNNAPRHGRQKALDFPNVAVHAVIPRNLFKGLDVDDRGDHEVPVPKLANVAGKHIVCSARMALTAAERGTTMKDSKNEKRVAMA